MLFDLKQPTWFHVHTDVTDGSYSVENIFEEAQKRGVGSIVFLEHIRRDPTYDVKAWEEEIRLFASEYGIETKVGFEAKILPDGELDISDEDFARAEIIGIAEHGFPDNLTLFMEAWEEVMEEAEKWAKEKPVVWVHPGLFFRKNRLMDSYFEEYKMLLDKALAKGVLLEHNLRYNLLERSLVGDYPNIVGIDLHQEVDIVRWENSMMVSA